MPCACGSGPGRGNRRPATRSAGSCGFGMSGLVVLIPIAICLGLVALATFLWALRSGQYDDLDGASERIFDDDLP